MPPRSEDLAALRTFAAAHAAAHAKVSTVNPNAYCHCGSQRCGAHPNAKTSCEGAVVMILRHDPIVRRVWSLEEVCETCALPAARPNRTTKRPETPAAQVPAPARPGIAGGFSSAPAEGDPAPGRRPHRAPQRPHRRSSGQGR